MPTRADLPVNASGGDTGRAGRPFRKAVSRAAVLTLGNHLASQALRLAGNLVLTRVMVPEAFGLMLVATAVWVGLVLLSDFGFRQVLVRSPRASEPDFVNTVWTLQLLQGAIVAALLLAVAAGLSAARGAGLFPAGSILARPELPCMVAGLSIAAVLAGAQSTKLDLACRELRLGRVSCIEIASQAVALGVMVGFALWTRSVYSLVLGACCSAACKTLCSHAVLAGPANRLRYCPQAAREIFGFGRWIIASSCIAFAIGHGDRLVLAWLLGVREMGYYAIAALLVAVTHDLVGKMLGRVVYPALRRAADDRGDLRGAYLRARSTVDFVCAVAAGLLAGCGDLVVRLLYDERYADAGGYLRVLGVSLLGIRYRVLGQVFLVIGRPQLMLYEQVLHVSALGAGIFLGFRLYGVAGAVQGVALSYLVAQAWNVFCAQPRLGLVSLRTEVVSLAVFGAALAAGLGVRNLVP